MAALQLTPQLLAWCALVLVLLRGFPARRQLSAVICGAGFAAGVAGVQVLTQSFPATTYGVVRSLLGGSFLALWGVSMAALYRSTGRERPARPGPA